MTAPIGILTIHLPADAARRLRRVAEIARRPLDEIIADTLQGSLPPLLEDAPLPYPAELAGLESLSTAALWQQLRAALPRPKSRATTNCWLRIPRVRSLTPNALNFLDCSAPPNS